MGNQPSSLTASRAANGTERPCPLCTETSLRSFHQDRRRTYQRCDTCSLISVPGRFFLSAAEEKAEYDLHQNSPGDLGYRRFLGRLFLPLSERLSPHSRGLDFGCGPGPTLSVMFEEIGHQVALYDPFYAPNRQRLDRRYDFVTATEVLEHLHRPGPELQTLWQCVQPGGWLGIMTKLALGAEEFARWHYKNDPTHVSFFSSATFDWLGDQLGSRPIFIGKDVILFRREISHRNILEK